MKKIEKKSGLDIFAKKNESTFKVKQVQTVFSGQTFNVVSKKIQIDETIINFECIERQEVALIIPLLTSEKIIILKQFRAPIADFILEFPAGKQNKNESIIETAKRELQEETGYIAHKLDQISSFLIAPHLTNEKIHIFVATDLEKGSESFQEKEFITNYILTIDELKVQFTKQINLDAKSILAFNIFLNNKDYV